MSSLLSQLRRTLAREDVRSISRRYFISNGFDGTLTSIGVIVGAVLSGVPDGITVFKIGLGAAVGLATSGVWSVWEIERAEMRANILDIERAMLTDLDDTSIERRHEGARRVHALMSGLGPIIGVIVPLTPFLLHETVFTLVEAAVVGVLLGTSVLFVFGAYLGTVSKQRWYVSGLRMGLAGIVVAIVNILVG